MTVQRDDDPAPYEVYTSLLAHELRTPVTSINGYLELLQDESLLDDRETLVEFLGIVRQQATDLARTVTELTTFASISNGQLEQAPRDRSTAIPEIVREFAAGRPVRLECEDAVAECVVDSERLRLVLSVLMENAWRYGSQSTEIAVRAAVEQIGRRLVVRVTNHGPLIAPELREAIFGPFRQAEYYATRRLGGLGLGLAVARRAAEGAGGILVLDPDPPTTFRLELPLREDAIVRQSRQFQVQAALADAQSLRAIKDVRTLRAAVAAERELRERSEAQQLKTIEDFCTSHREARALVQRLDQSYLETVTALARAVEARDGYTGIHVERVRRHSLLIADALQLDREERRYLEFGAVLHDIGKIAIPDAILTKPGPLTDAEWEVMRSHPKVGCDILHDIAFLVSSLSAVSSHHERWDGRGYPAQLAGDAIPLHGRIVGVADAFDAMTADRPYRPGMPIEEARAGLVLGQGTQFDAEVVQAFLGSLPMGEVAN